MVVYLPGIGQEGDTGQRWATAWAQAGVSIERGSAQQYERGNRVSRDTAKVGDLPTLWAVLHADDDVKGVFEWGWKGQPYNDPPITVNGREIVTAFGTAAAE